MDHGATRDRCGARPRRWSCPTKDAVGVCAATSHPDAGPTPEGGAVTGDVFYCSGGEGGYEADEVPYACKHGRAPRTVAGISLPPAAPRRVSCVNDGRSTCHEDDYQGWSPRIGACTRSRLNGEVSGDRDALVVLDLIEPVRAD